MATEPLSFQKVLDSLLANSREFPRQYLQEFSVRPEFVHRHRWRLHDAVLWDNRCAQHCATPFDDARYRRHMLRTTLEGDKPVMATTSPGSSLATH